MSAKGYQVVNDPDSAHYVLLANIVYCNITKPEMPVEAMVASGYGSAFNSAMGAMQGLTSMASMAGPYGAMGGAAASMGLSAIQGIGDLFSSSSSAPTDAGRRELCLRGRRPDHRTEERPAAKWDEDRNGTGARRLPDQTGRRCPPKEIERSRGHAAAPTEAECRGGWTLLMRISSRRVMGRSLLLSLLLLLTLTTGCSNVIRSGLMNSNTIFLDPNTNRTVYTQLRNASENQQVTLSEVNTKLRAKGYQLIQDPEQANYWIQAKVIYCHRGS